MLTFAGASESGLELPERAPAFLAEVHAGRFSQPFASYAACNFDEMMIYSKNLEVPRNAYQRELNPNRVRKIAA
ncbi:hypothetical protein NE475_19795, partial [Ruthenibacterium lactatiformans]|nr:hypothetical protein [Ruthenibacterium lactatiformans]